MITKGRPAQHPRTRKEKKESSKAPLTLKEKKIAEPWLVGDKAAIEKIARDNSLEIGGIPLVDPTTHVGKNDLVNLLFEKRKAKGWTLEQSAEAAMLSFSTKGSAAHADVDKVVSATKMAKEKARHLQFDGLRRSFSGPPRPAGRTKVIAFLTDYTVVDRITDHLKLTFAAAKPPPSHVFAGVARMEAEESVD